MQLQFLRFSELILHKLFGGWHTRNDCRNVCFDPAMVPLNRELESERGSNWHGVFELGLEAILYYISLISGSRIGSLFFYRREPHFRGGLLSLPAQKLSLPTSHAPSRSLSATFFPFKALSYSCATDFAAAFKNSRNLPAGIGPVTRPWLCCLTCNEQKSASGWLRLPHWAPLPPPHTLAKHLALLTCEGMWGAVTCANSLTWLVWGMEVKFFFAFDLSTSEAPRLLSQVSALGLWSWWGGGAAGLGCFERLSPKISTWKCALRFVSTGTGRSTASMNGRRGSNLL